MDMRELRRVCQGEKFEKNYSHALYIVHRRLSIYLTAGFIKANIPANLISTLMILFGVLSCWAFAIKFYWIGIGLFYISFILDKCDGEVARYHDNKSSVGVYLDELYHFAINSMIFAFIAISLMDDGVHILVMGLVASYLYVLWRSEYKIFYTVLTKIGRAGMPVLHINVLHAVLLRISRLSKFILTEDVVILHILVAVFFDRLEAFIYWYAFVLFVAIPTEVYLSLSGTLHHRLSGGSNSSASLERC